MNIDLLRDKYLFYEHEWVPLISVDILSTVLSKLQLTDEEVKSAFAQEVELGKSMCVMLSNDDSIQKLLNNLWMAMRKSEREDLLAKVMMSTHDGFLIWTWINC